MRGNCTAEAAFFYGVYIESAYLCSASDRPKANKASPLAIDLISYRRRKGLLVAGTGNSSAILSVPYEVWEMIKLQMIDIGMREAERNVLKKYFGEGEGDPTNWEREAIYSDSVESFEYFGDEGGMEEMLESRKLDLQILLDTFGLDLPFENPHSMEDFPECEPFALSAISLPLRKTGSPPASRLFPTLKSGIPTEGGSTHATAQFTEDSFKLPSDAKRRIQNFLSFFRLKPINPASVTIYRPRLNKMNPSKLSKLPTPAAKKEEETNSRKTTHKSKCCSHPETEPHWHLWVSSRWMY